MFLSRYGFYSCVLADVVQNLVVDQGKFEHFGTCSQKCLWQNKGMSGNFFN